MPRTTPGGQAWYSDAAIEPVLRLVFHLPPRQAEGFTASILRLLGHELRVTDHTTLSPRDRGFAGRRPEVIGNGPLHLAIDSTGLKLFGQGEWDEEKHRHTRRSWRKLHIAVEAVTSEIVACVLTDSQGRAKARCSSCPVSMAISAYRGERPRRPVPGETLSLPTLLGG